MNSKGGGQRFSKGGNVPPLPPRLKETSSYISVLVWTQFQLVFTHQSQDIPMKVV